MKKLVFLLTILIISNSSYSQDVPSSINEGYGEYLLVPAGSFQMGDNFDEGRGNELPVHSVYLDSFYVGKYEVTNGEYKKFIEDFGYSTEIYWSAGGFRTFGSKPRYWNVAKTKKFYIHGGGLPGNENYPVVGVSWFEAMAYCSWLSYKTGKTFRLPTEAEWEKAARGTKQFRYSWGNYIDSSYANYWSFEDSGEKGISPVGYYDGSLQGNFKTSDGSSPYGTYDMTGNVWEWCSDWFSDTYFETSPTNNPTGPPSGPTKIKRGGSWIHIPEIQRSALRTSDGPMDRIEDLGFRCVQSISDKFDIESMFTSKQYIVGQNYPNPFNQETTIRYQLPKRGHVSIKIYDILGRELKTLVNRIQSVGIHVLVWDGTNNSGSKISSGVYFYKIQTEDFLSIKKMIWLK